MDNIFSRISCCGTSSSSPTVDVSHFKAEIDGNFSKETLDELISHINLLLKKLKGEQDSMSVAASSAGVTAARSTAGKILEELAKCIEYNMVKVKRNAKKAKTKVMDALDSGTTKLIGEILKESKAFPYVGIAAAVVVCVLDKIDQMRKVDDERLKFLERMWSMVKIINNVRNPEHRDQCGEMFRFVLKMSICIVNKIQQTPGLVSFLSSNIDAADLEDMERKFADQHQNLMTDFIVSIRNDIPQVKPPPPILDMPDTYGIEEAIEEVKTRLDMEGNSQKIIVTIFGLGGIGKTTLAEAVTNSLSDYKFCRLYLDLKSSKIEALQAQLLQDVFSENQRVSNPSEGRTFILDAVKKNQEKKPLYLFIDNALEGSEIENLLPLESISKLSLEVRILVTTRDSSKIPLVLGFEDKKYRVGGNPSAKEMLCHYAGENPNSEFANMKEVDEVLDMCGGIPLFIKLAGKKLHKQVDKAKICRQMKSTALGVDNNRILDFAYNQLPRDFQQAFLDIAFFYLGCQRYKLELIYTQDVIKGLEDAALITQDRDRKERVRMHDRLRERAHDLSKGERVSDRSEWEEAIQSGKPKLETIRALELQDVQPEDIEYINKCSNLTSLFLDLSIEKYKSNSNPMHMDLSLPACIKVLCITGPAAITIRQWKHLEVLKLKHVNVKGSLKNFGREGRPEKLIFMDLVDFTGENATVFPMSNYRCLKRLRLGGSMLESFPNKFQNVSSLESLKLDKCRRLIRLDSGISGCSNLSLLSLKFCEMLQNLPQEIGELQRLEKLDLKGCTNLQTLPETVGRLQHLKILDLSSCTGLKNLPESFGHLSSLEKLNMQECKNLESLCDSFGQLSRLQKLNLYNCENLQRLPESLEGLKCLTKLMLIECSGLKILPESFGHISYLEELNMSYCENLESLCDSLSKLSRLQKLDLFYCKSLQRLPESLEGLQCLTELILIECSGLKILPESFGLLSSLEKLKISNCTNLENLCDSFGKLSRLQELELPFCIKLQKLPESLEGLKSLKRLLLRGCKELKSLPETFGHLSSLEKLDMSRCVNLENLCDSFSKLSRLQELDLEDCGKLQKLPESLEGLKCLKRLLLWGCKELKSLPESFGHLSSLEKLDMSRCVNLESLCDSFSNLSRLQELHLSESEKIQNLPESLEGLKCLTKLWLERCTGLKSLPESLGGLQCLKILVLVGCKGLECLPPSFSQLSSLEELDMRECSSLEYLCDNFGKLTRLEKLNLTDCEKLQRLPESFGGLLSLKELRMVNCGSIKCLPQSFSRLSSLEELNMKNCISISGSLEFFGGLSSLRKLMLAGCSGLEKLPENLGKFLPSLLVVDVRGCHQLIRNDGLTELLSMQSLLIILHSTSTHSNVLRFVIGNDIHLDHVMEENQHLYQVMEECHSEVETLLKGGRYMRLEEGGEMVWEDAVSSGVARTGAKIAYLNTGWCRDLPYESKAELQEAVDEGYEVVLVDNGVHRWNMHVAVEGKKLNGEVPWNEEDTEMMKEMMCQVPGGCTTVWTSSFPKNCLLLTMLLYAVSDPWMEEVTMTKGKGEGDDNQSNTFNFEESKWLLNNFYSFRNKDGIEILGCQFRDNLYGLAKFFSDIMDLKYWLIKDSESG